MRASATRWQDAAAAAIAAALDATSLQSRRWTACGGSSLNETWRLDAGGARYFVKVNGLARQSMLEAEADGLAALARPGVLRVPAPVAHSAADGVAFLVLEWLDFTGGGPGCGTRSCACTT